ncbi:gamma-aminobutyrate permease, partial [Staphylococcus hominis]
MANQENQNTGIKRGLKDRHISMIAIGGCIGTGLFMTSGGAIHDAGALGALLA